MSENITKTEADIPQEQTPQADLRSAVVALSGIMRTRHIMRSTAAEIEVDEDHIHIMLDREINLLETVEEHVKWKPGILANLEQEESEAIGKALGIIKLLTDKNGDESSPYREDQYEEIEESTVVISALHHIRNNLSDNEIIQRGFDLSSTSEDHVPSIVIEIDAAENVFIGDVKLKLKPVERVIIDAIIDADGPLKYSDIYQSARFAEARTQQKLSAPPVVCMSNSLNGLERKLMKAGAPLESFVEKGGKKSARTITRSNTVEVIDQRLAGKISLFAEYILDQTDIGETFDIKAVAAGFFGVEQVGGRYEYIVKKALGELRTSMGAHGTTVEEDPALHQVVLQTDTRHRGRNLPIDNTDKGRLIRIAGDRLVYERGAAHMTKTEEHMLSILLDGRKRGVTRAHIKHSLERTKSNVREFDLDFDRMRRKLGQNLTRPVEGGRTRYKLDI